MSIPTVAVNVFATGRYIEFVPKLVASMEQYWSGVNTNLVVWTNKTPDFFVPVMNWPHLPWPLGTMLRYNAIVSEPWASDYVMMIDADMEFVAPVGPEILSRLTLVQHPGFYKKPQNRMPFETNPKSAAFTPEHLRKTYYAGGVVLGERDEFLKMARVIADGVATDIKNHVIPVWHEESHLNRYAASNPPALSLTPAHCFSDTNPNAGIQPIIKALTKKHEDYRK